MPAPKPHPFLEVPLLTGGVGPVEGGVVPGGDDDDERGTMPQIGASSKPLLANCVQLVDELNRAQAASAPVAPSSTA